MKPKYFCTSDLNLAWASAISQTLTVGFAFPLGGARHFYPQADAKDDGRTQANGKCSSHIPLLCFDAAEKMKLSAYRTLKLSYVHTFVTASPNICGPASPKKCPNNLKDSITVTWFSLSVQNPSCANNKNIYQNLSGPVTESQTASSEELP